LTTPALTSDGLIAMRSNRDPDNVAYFTPQQVIRTADEFKAAQQGDGNSRLAPLVGQPLR
jgi:hypothetical protein